ncbi:hypothetical protein [Haladaptatus litoreus]|nr:hypothetical protein [Haladaptatus litoreus]
MSHGHDPRAIDEYPIKDVWLFMDCFPTIQALTNPFAGGVDD